MEGTERHEDVPCQKTKATVIARSEYEISILSIKLTLSSAINCSPEKLCSFHSALSVFQLTSDLTSRHVTLHYSFDRSLALVQ